MQYLKSYFDDSITLEELNECYSQYDSYLKSKKKYFDEYTYNIILDDYLHDYKVLSMHMDSTVDKEFVYHSHFTINLVGEEKKYTLIYQDLLFLSIEKEVSPELGFDDILISEFTVDKDDILHELVFFGEVSWSIKCKKFQII